MMKEPRICLLKVLYYEAWENTNRKDKELHCKDCLFKDRCKELIEINKKSITDKE